MRRAAAFGALRAAALVVTQPRRREPGRKLVQEPRQRGRRAHLEQRAVGPPLDAKLATEALQDGQACGVESRGKKRGRSGEGELGWRVLRVRESYSRIYKRVWPTPRQSRACAVARRALTYSQLDAGLLRGLHIRRGEGVQGRLGGSRSSWGAGAGAEAVLPAAPASQTAGRRPTTDGAALTRAKQASTSA